VTLIFDEVCAKTSSNYLLMLKKLGVCIAATKTVGTSQQYMIATTYTVVALNSLSVIPATINPGYSLRKADTGKPPMSLEFPQSVPAENPLKPNDANRQQ
jgi:hypothetical protein